MKKSYAIGHSLLHGLGWGLLIATLNGPAFPVIFELYGFVGAILQGGKWRGFIGLILPEIWYILFLQGITYFSAPSIIGGCLLALALRYLPSDKILSQRYSLWVGVVIGSLVALGGISWLFLKEEALRDRLFALLIFIWLIVIFSLVSQRLTPTTR